MPLGEKDELIANTNSLLLQQVAKFLGVAYEHGIGICSQILPLWSLAEF